MLLWTLMSKFFCGHIFLSLLSMYLAVNLLGHLEIDVEPLEQGCQTHLHWGPHQPHGFLQRAEIMLGLYNCNYSLTVKEFKLHLTVLRQWGGWYGPRWTWVWHPDLEELPDCFPFSAAMCEEGSSFWELFFSHYSNFLKTGNAFSHQ